MVFNIVSVSVGLSILGSYEYGSHEEAWKRY